MQGGYPRGALVAEIAGDLADGGVVFLFNIAIVVFVGGAAREKATPWR
ncbi:MAG: hypothetical protein LBB98_11290 [Treponema sp.]|nr:hypothetical protein [Treponema sp.]